MLYIITFLFAMTNSQKTCEIIEPAPNNCISFTVGQGTGCAWMCNYCGTNLGPNYYFTDNVCVYEAGGCVGNPVAGKTYTCCSN
jgi:hypothetical protein